MNPFLQKRVDNIFDHIYAESKIKNPEVIAYEVSKLLHTGMYIEKEKKSLPAFKDFLPLGNDGLFFSANDTQSLINQIKDYFKEMNIEWALYKGSEKLKLSNNDIYYICSTLHDLKISSKDLDIIGDALEIFRNYSIKSLGGQFFTDPAVTQLALSIIDFNPLKGETFIDICAGTGGFLLAAINHTRNIIEKERADGDGHLAHIALRTIKGMEIDQTVARAANSTIKSRLGVNLDLVTNDDSLTSKSLLKDTYSCVATNPPFGTKTTIKDIDILKRFELAYNNSTRKLVPTPPDILFLEKNIELLVPDKGRLAIVLPYQILSGPRAEYIRKWLLQRCRILAVIDLPAETFQPHTGTKTSLVVVRKRKQVDIELRDANYTIFMAKPKWIGHDRRGNPVYRVLEDGTSSSDILCDFDMVSDAWHKTNNGEAPKSELCFLISAKKVIADKYLRLNALYHDPYFSNSRNRLELDENSKTKLKHLTHRIFYPGRFKRNYVSSLVNSVPFLGGSNITEHIISTKKYLSRSDPHLDQLVVREGWILVTRSGTTGIISMVPKEWDGFAISEHVIRIVPDPTKIDPLYLYSYLQTDYAREQLRRGIFGSVIDEINPDFVGEIEIPLIADESKLASITCAMRKYQEARDISIRAFHQAVSLAAEMLS